MRICIYTEWDALQADFCVKMGLQRALPSIYIYVYIYIYTRISIFVCIPLDIQD